MPAPETRLVALVALTLLVGGWLWWRGDAAAQGDAPGAVAAAPAACTPPESFAMPPLEPPDPAAVRRTPVTRYTLAISWSPGHCARNRGRDLAADDLQCRRPTGRFGFVLHGLWPETNGRNWPQYCRLVGPVAAETLRAQLCRTPSPDLLQHEWIRHGTCMAETPEEYFATAARLYDRVVMPDMAALATANATAGDLRRAFASANPGLSPAAVSVQLSDGNWLNEVRLCLDRSFAYADCPAGERGAADGQTMRVQPQR